MKAWYGTPLEIIKELRLPAKLGRIVGDMADAPELSEAAPETGGR